MATRLFALLGDDAGGTLVEYALVLALVAVAATLSIKKFGTKLVTLYTTIQKDVKKS